MERKEYYINAEGEFVIEDYNRKKPFSSFLPAVAGLYGKPMWVYYVNRGQCIATFGVNNKDCSIMEFQPANKAYRQTALQGFRTFLKLTKKDGSQLIYEPFQHTAEKTDINQNMRITSYDFKLEDINETLGIKTTVMFCTLPGEILPALIRTVHIENIGTEDIQAEVLDGIPVIIPYYLINHDMKNESNLRQAWMSADMNEGMPFYRIKALPYDTPETVLLKGGNFYLNFTFNEDNMQINPTITDPALIFGERVDFTFPEMFAHKDFQMPKKQVSVGYTPCGFGYSKFVIKPGKPKITYTLAGSASCWEEYKTFVERIHPSYMKEKILENEHLIERTKRHIFTSSNSKEFDLYCGQTFMDNYLRGGYPVAVGNGAHTLYVYSRKHGDLEREYNFFQVDSTNYSQGNSNFRDVNQNRRNDVYFFPFIKDSGIKTFFQLIQLDGFNPLVLNGARFKVKDHAVCISVIKTHLKDAKADMVMSLLKPAFTPGKLLLALEQQGIYMEPADKEIFINDLLETCEKEEASTFQEGYWVDHWTYNNDLLEQFMEIYPDETVKMMFEDNEYTYYDSDEVVLPRHKRYLLTENGVRQYNSVVTVADKKWMISQREVSPNTVRTAYGNGELYKTTLASKIITLLVNKAASLDPQGIGLEMEGNKPGWCDALNGLPGILGSSINESTEVKRLADIMRKIFKQTGEVSIALPLEVKMFFDAVHSLLSAACTDMEYWSLTNDAKEAYREQTIFGLSGEEACITKEEALAFVEKLSEKINAGLKKALDTSGVYHTYYIHQVASYEKAEEVDGKQFVHATAFNSRPIPPFLEGQVHMMRIDKAQGEALHKAVKQSGMYDEKLDMFKVNANIMEETKEIGRQNVFPRGWLENEAVFLHMEYKYFLELLRCGQYEEFYHYLKKAGIPFLDPAVYGRSTLENCSFIVSSAHPDARIHGSGYVSRLTGASTEFLHMWRLMTVGTEVFRTNELGGLQLVLEPKLPNWLFIEEEKETVRFTETAQEVYTQPENSFACMLLGHTLLTYHNPKRLSTYDENVAVVGMHILDHNGKATVISGNMAGETIAKQIRSGGVKQIDAVIGRHSKKKWQKG